MLTRRRSPYWRRVLARPKPGGCGPTSATSGLCRFRPAGGPVLLLARPKGRTPAGPPEGLPRCHPRRRLCRVQRTVRRRADCRGRLLGACAAQILRCSGRHHLTNRQFIVCMSPPTKPIASGKLANPSASSGVHDRRSRQPSSHRLVKTAYELSMGGRTENAVGGRPALLVSLICQNAASRFRV
jgi:hypothetical protein